MTDLRDIKRIIKEYYEQLYAHKFNKMDKEHVNKM